MCTVTVIPLAARMDRELRSPLVRIVCNRDEQRSRPVSGRPVQLRLGDRAAIMPLDPWSGGSWIGANDTGLVACLLNANPHGPSSDEPAGTLRSSRGEIVPALLGAATLSHARELAGGLVAMRYPPFRVLVLNAVLFFMVSWDGASLTLSECEPLRSPILLTSSGLGDHLVEHVRRALFDRLVCGAQDLLAAQECFHWHRWIDRPHISVLMSRPDARTVSRCVLDVFAESAVLLQSNLNDQLVEAHPAWRCDLRISRSEVNA